MQSSAWSVSQLKSTRKYGQRSIIGKTFSGYIPENIYTSYTSLTTVGTDYCYKDFNFNIESKDKHMK